MESHVFGQVAGFFAWIDWLCARAARLGREPLFVNADETGILYSYHSSPGVVVRRVPEGLGRFRLPRSPPPSRSGQVTFLCLLSSEHALQAQMPQFIIGNASKFSRRFLLRHRPLCPHGVFLLPRASGWTDGTVICQMLTALKDALRRHRRYQPIVLLDGYLAHVTQKVIRHAGSLRLWPCVVPPGLTWLLQPLDTHVFSALKHRLRHLWVEAEDRSGDLWLQHLLEVAGPFLQERDWSAAFAACGITRHPRTSLHGELLARVPGVETWPVRPVMPPALDLLLPSRAGSCRADFVAACH